MWHHSNFVLSSHRLYSQDIGLLIKYAECTYISYFLLVRRGGVEVAGWTVDRTIRVRFPAYLHRVWALW